MKTFILVLTLIVPMISWADNDLSEMGRKYCQGDQSAFQNILQLPPSDPASLQSYLTVLQSDSGVDEIIKRYSATNVQDLSESERIVYGVAQSRKDSQMSKKAMEAFAIPAKDETVEAYRIAILNSQFHDHDGAARAMPQLQNSLAKLKYSDLGILSSIMNADLYLGTSVSAGETYIPMIENMKGREVYRDYLRTKLRWIKLAKNSLNLGATVSSDFKKSYEACPTSEEFVLSYVNFLTAERKYDEAKTVLTRFAEGRRYYSPYVNLYLLFIAYEQKDRDAITGMLPQVNAKGEVFTALERAQIRNIEKTNFDDPIRQVMWAVIAAVCLGGFFMFLRQRYSKK